MGKFFKISALSAFLFSAACGVASAAQGDLLLDPCPVSWKQLSDAMHQADTAVVGDFNNPMWGVVVNRNGTVCAVAFSGSNAKSQWLVSRSIAASKAWTANGLSFGSKLFATSQLFDLTQPNNPKGTLYGVGFGSNPEDAADIYKGPISAWGQGGIVQDPLVGRRVGGFISFGGGVALVNNGPIGALGVSGDSACRDDAYARKVREILKLAPASGADGTACVPKVN
jgi:uncharacterized protein GlcG (DUF336 family)